VLACLLAAGGADERPLHPDGWGRHSIHYAQRRSRTAYPRAGWRRDPLRGLRGACGRTRITSTADPLVCKGRLPLPCHRLSDGHCHRTPRH
jgi:hypothetical protein